MKNWGFGKKKKLKDIWPKKENGEMIAPAFLIHTGGGPLDAEMTVSMLEAYGIPVVCRYPNDGEFGKLIVGRATGGVDIFVPETLLSEAKDILNADFVTDDEAEEFEDI